MRGLHGIGVESGRGVPANWKAEIQMPESRPTITLAFSL
jgi:hypothetical protein